LKRFFLPAGLTKNYFIYPKNTTGAGYILNLETRSFGRIPSENLLTKVEFYPVDDKYLNNFIDLPAKAISSIQNNLKVLETKKYGNWL